MYTSLADAAQGSTNDPDPGAQVQSWAHAVRNWALANPEGFRLIFGEAVPGYIAPTGGAALEAELRFCTGLTALAAAAWPSAAYLYADSEIQWSDFESDLLDLVRPAFPDLPPAGVALSVYIWGQVHGLVSLEIYGHLRTPKPSRDKLFREQMTRLVRSLGLVPKAGAFPDL
ncbi:hypothetical protein JOF56_009825 [Kibdelosporangium banguiense]|uniref:HTH-type transcriptional regulator MT1864/Rv1816-like C-terminal domain-containing protein n=1 Tax=Kibdelosporangium banguiense TaxID=1365924 RepID=A0ABS4TYG7_9PSEU|nr:TetR-like C-terminal domain-containing protein [Kibdelosporangium banguiense]MBP2329440.1 hypothetical protein [Kibdelosporangium banguiense]